MTRQGDRTTIRVVYCIDNMDIGGTELNVVRTAERLDRRRFTVQVATMRPDGPLRGRYDRAGIPVSCFPISNLYGPRTLLEGLRFARWLRRERVDVFHSFDVYSNIFGGPWARLARVRAVIASRRWWDSLPRPSLRIANRFAMRFAHRVVANSPSVGRLVEQNDNVRANRVAVIPNFVDEGAFHVLSAAERASRRTALGIPEDAVVVGMVARLAPVKDHVTLLRAAARLRAQWPAVWFVLVGDGEERPALEAEARTLGILDRVIFAGMQPHQPNVNHLFDIAVLCSRNEAFPNAVVEALAAGTPVVATRVGGVPDAIDDGVNGRLIPPGNAERLAEVLAELLAAPEVCRTLGTAGQAVARARYAEKTVIAELERLYAGLVA